MKWCLINAPILGLPIDEGRYYIDCDASGVAAGSALSQEQNGELLVIAYASWVFKDAELRYSTNQQELAAVIFGLRQYKQYVLGREFTLRSDHSALRYLMTAKEVSAVQGRYLDFLAQFEGMKIEHRPNTAHTNADGLSRRPEGSTVPSYEVGTEAANAIGSREQSGDIDGVIRTSAHAADVIGVARGLQPSTEAARPAAARDLAARAEIMDAADCLVEADDIMPESLATMRKVATKRGMHQRVSLRTTQERGRGLDTGPLNADTVTDLSSGTEVLPNKRFRRDYLTLDSYEALAELADKNWTKLQQEDPVIREIYALKADLATDDVSLLSRTDGPYAKDWDRLFVDDGLLVRVSDKDEAEPQIVIPEREQRQVIEICHAETGHQGQANTAKRASRRLFFPSWRKVIIEVCRSCPVCVRSRRGRPEGQNPTSCDMVSPNAR